MDEQLQINQSDKCYNTQLSSSLSHHRTATSHTLIRLDLSSVSGGQYKFGQQSVNQSTPTTPPTVSLSADFSGEAEVEAEAATAAAVAAAAAAAASTAAVARIAARWSVACCPQARCAEKRCFCVTSSGADSNVNLSCVHGARALFQSSPSAFAIHVQQLQCKQQS